MDTQTNVQIFNRYEDMMYFFKFEKFPTLPEVQEKISKELHIQCEDLILYEFGANYAESA